LHDRFFLLGKKINPYPYIKGCDIYVQPSRYEGKAVTIREAQILGKPVVISNFPTAKSQARNEIDALITSQDPDGIANGIRRLIDEPELRNRLTSNVLSIDYGNENEIDKLYSLIG
jgi:glycosyltransferase involved in cell wall biosynthesis